jgi:phosphotriesterase-related protein
MVYTRRSFVGLSLIPLLGLFSRSAIARAPKSVMTVLGPIPPEKMGSTLIHEHILVDFGGAATYDPLSWNRDQVADTMLPHLLKAKRFGCSTFVDCTPNYLGRDVRLLRKLAEESGLHIITNTGYYGGSDNKFLPAHAFTETAEQLAARWTNEARKGIDQTNIRPGFIKISVNDASLTPISKKLITAAGLTHQQTGLTIASHTGPAVPAFEQLDILQFTLRVNPRAFIWVHAQNERDISNYVKAVKRNCWISLDGVSDENARVYAEKLLYLKEEKCLNNVLISHDAGWFDPDKPDATIRSYDAIYAKLLPMLRENGFSDEEITMLLVKNPAKAFSIERKTANGTKK